MDRPSVPPTALAAALRRYWKTRRWKSIDRLVVGSKGVWPLPERRRMAGALGGLAAVVTVVSDVELGLWASLGRRTDPTGVYLAAGTGSIALARTRGGTLRRAGGLGPKKGDEGSGFWIGREYLRRVKGTGYRGAAATPARVRKTAALAERVLRDGSPLCRAIVREAQTHLAALALRAARGLPRPVKFAWGGSLMLNPGFRRGVAAALRGFRPTPPPRSLTRAAAAMAARLNRGQPRLIPPRA